MFSQPKSAARFVVPAICAALSLLGTNGAKAQDLSGIMRQNMEFDAAMGARLGALQAQNAAGQQALWQNYLRQNGPWLQQQYAATGASRQMSFEQFAYYNMMTANGTNVAGGLQAQRDQFEGGQQAARTQREGGQIAIDAMRENGRRQSEAVGNWTQGAINGNAQYINPQTGTPQWMLHHAPGQVRNHGGASYVQTPNGQYYQQQGNYWVPMQPTGR